MALTQGLDIKEGEDLVRLEQFEGRNVPCNRSAYPAWVRSVMIPLMILQKMQAAILPGVWVCVKSPDCLSEMVGDGGAEINGDQYSKSAPNIQDPS